MGTNKREHSRELYLTTRDFGVELTVCNLLLGICVSLVPIITKCFEDALRGQIFEVVETIRKDSSVLHRIDRS
jgi:hypothetical protein